MLIHHNKFEGAVKIAATSLTLIIAATGASAADSSRQDLARLGSRLRAMPEFAAEASWQVLMPQADSPVEYAVALESLAVPADSLAPCDYLLSWRVDTPSGPVDGFAAYFSGNHFRLRDERLQEYHAAWDAEPFAPACRPEAGVQLQAQFVSLLPQVIGLSFERMAADSTYTFTIDHRAGRIAVRGVQTVAGYDCLEYCYEFDAADLRPLSATFENNPGLISEQSVAVAYRYPEGAAARPVDMDRLLASWPEAFSRYRESTFSLETLPGRYLPAFSTERLDGSRYTHHATDCLAEPTVFVMLDAAVASTPRVIAEVRAALAEIPDPVDVVWAFVSNHADEISALVGSMPPEETALVGARSLARDCGVADTPALIFCSPRARVADVIVGFNNQLRPLVIQKAMIARYFSDPESEIIEN